MKKFMSLLLGAMLILSLIPMSVGATTENWNSFVYYQDGPEFSVEATEFVGAGDYKFIAAAYDANGKLVDMTSSDAAVKAGTLTAAASFEAPGEEADVSIASVKTMLWDSFSGATPIAAEGNFEVAPQTVNENGIYSSLTNGFYEAVEAQEGYRNTWKHLSADESGKEVIDSTPAGTDSWTLNYWGLNQNFSDNDLTTNCTHGGEADARLVASMLKEASKIDRVVLYSFETRVNAEDAPRQKGTEYYLTNSFIHPVITTNSTADDIATANTNVNAYWNSLTVDADNADVYYLGTSESMAKVATDDDAKLVYDVNSENSYQYIVGKKSALKGVGGLTQELQAYTKIRNKVIIDAFTASVEYNGLSYSQNGPEFTVKAGEVTSNTDLALKATAYNAAGDVVAEVTEPIANPGVEFDINATVNFEEDGEANASIASVKTVITDTFGTAVVEDSTFTVTANTCTDGTDTHPMTNGFYQPITTYQNDYRSRYVGGYASWSNGGCVYDGDLTTTEGFASGRLTTGQIHVELSAMTQIDRVVVYNFWSGQSQAGTEFYLSSVTPTGSSNTDEEHLAYYNKFTPDTTVEGIYYLGTQTKAPANVDADGARLVFDVDKNAGTFNRLIARYEKDVNGGYIEEYQAYQKVKQTNVISEPVINVDYDGLVYNQNGPEFSVTAPGFTANADALIFKATAYNSAGEVKAEKTKEIAVADEAFILHASVNFEENGTEADASIASVKTVVTDTAGTAVLEESTFAITPQSVENGVYNSFTNGFYQSVTNSANITESKMYKWVSGSYANGWAEPQTNGVYNLHDHVTNNNNAYNQPASTENHWQDITTLSSAMQIDRVVVYVPYATTDFYLANAVDMSSTGRNAHIQLFTGKDTDNIHYLGNGNSADASGATNRYMFNADGGSYQYVIADYTAGATRCYDIQAYSKVKQTNVISAFDTTVDYTNVTFSQDGPVFSIAAEDVVSTAADLFFAATAYDADGEVVAEKTDAIKVPVGAATDVAASVDFEEDGEADASITKVTATITDSTGTAVIRTQDFEVTADVATHTVDEVATSYTMMNGFYEPIACTSDFYYAYNHSKQETIGIDKLNLWGQQGKFYDSNLNTESTSGNNYNVSGFVGVDLGSAQAMDKVVVWGGYASTKNAPVFATNYDLWEEANAKTSDTELQTFFDSFADTANTADIYYLGTLKGGSVTDAANARNVFDTSDNAYRYIAVKLQKGVNGGGVQEIRGYKKVTAEYVYG